MCLGIIEFAVERWFAVLHFLLQKNYSQVPNSNSGMFLLIFYWNLVLVFWNLQVGDNLPYHSNLTLTFGVKRNCDLSATLMLAGWLIGANTV